MPAELAVAAARLLTLGTAAVLVATRDALLHDPAPALL